LLSMYDVGRKVILQYDYNVCIILLKLCIGLLLFTKIFIPHIIAAKQTIIITNQWEKNKINFIR